MNNENRLREKMALVDNYLTRLKPSSLNHLKVGTFVDEDIYSSDGSSLLIKGGNYLDEDAMAKMKSVNKDEDAIYVTNNMHLDMLRRNANEHRKELEKQTGYTESKKEAVEMLSEIAEDKQLDTKSILKVSVAVSGRVESTDPSTVFSLINALAPVDEYLQRHCVNTGMLNGLFGRWMGLSKEKIDRLVLIGLLHDVGKTLMPYSVLNASRRLTWTEYEVIKMHSLKSYELLNALPESVRRAARGHHEKYDGTGYPDGKKGDDISIEARITAISDVYDALVSQRAYKDSSSPFSIISMIESMSGSHFDPMLVKLFMKNMPGELIGKKVLMSDGSVGIVDSIDMQNIEYPFVRVADQLIHSSPNLHCLHML